MKVRLGLSGLLLSAVLLSYVEPGVIEISAYGNVSQQLRNGSVESPASSRAMSGGGTYRNIFDGLLTKPVNYATSSFQNSYKIPKYIVYPSNSQTVYPQQQLKEAVASDRFTPGEAYGGTVYKIQKAKYEKRKGYQYQKPNAAPFNDAKTNPPTSPVVAPAPPAPTSLSQPPSIITGPTPVPSKTIAQVNNPTADFPSGPSIEYIPPLDQNLFAPNTHSHYPPPPSNSETLFNGITSYLPPAAGPVVDVGDSKPLEVPSTIAGPTPVPATVSEKPSAPTENSPDNQYIPPSDPNLFAPNIHSHYPPPPANGETRYKGITSYLPPPAGPATDDSSEDSKQPDSPPSNQYIPPAELFQFPPNIHSHYLPPQLNNNYQTNGLTSYLPPPAGPTDAYLPPSAGMSADPPAPEPPSSPGSPDDTIGTIPIGPDTAYPAYLPPSAPQSPAPPAPKPQMMMAMPPPKDMVMSMPPNPPMSSHPMYLPFQFHGYENYHPHDHYPEYIYDHDHDHHHHHEPTTTPAPPPPPPPEPEPKLKNYKYYTISRTLWFIPLYFTIWFMFYILYCILRFVARRKVQYPNNWTGRALGLTSLVDDMQFLTNEQAMLKTDMMTQFVMQQIEDFKEKYLE